MSRALFVAFALAALTACDDTIFASGGGETPIGTDFCAVKQLFTSDCVVCHGVDGLGGLDLKTDPYAALVGVASKGDPSRILVVPGDPAASLLYLKVAGAEGIPGGEMPPGNPLRSDSLAAIETWITDGASATCEGGDSGDTDYHPDLWWMPENHGMAAKMQDETCITCHGDDLGGGTAGVSCDTCHSSGWREDCTFCHGGTDNGTGAPPRDIDGDTSGAAFLPHTAHVTAGISVARDCDSCHARPENVLSPGHIFIGDTTPGAAEVDLSGGLSSHGSYASSTCSNLYCHGNGRGDNGTVAASAGAQSCSSCHPDKSTSGKWPGMSGEHAKHMEVGATCSTCHSDTADASQKILSIALHVNGTADLHLPDGMTRSATSCAGTCHIGGETRTHEAEDYWP